MYKLVNEDSEGPYVCFRPVKIIYESFWAHVNWASDGYIFENLVGFDGEAEISKFISVLMDKNIRYFKITVDDAKMG